MADLVASWIRFHNAKDLSGLDDLYADEVIFYARKMPRAACMEAKAKAFRDQKNAKFQVVSQPSLLLYTSSVIKASFIERVISGGKSTDSKAYLLLKEVDRKLIIVGESDLDTDAKAGITLDLGEVIKAEPKRTTDTRILLIGFPFVALLLAVGFWLYKTLKHKHEAEREADRQLRDFFVSKQEEIGAAVESFSKYLDIDSGYFSNYQLTSWQVQFGNTFNEFKGKNLRNLSLPVKDVNQLDTLRDYFKNGSDIRKAFNRRYLSTELARYSSFFDDVEGRKLDEQQRLAIVTDEDSNLVIAGAGSGKTSTIVGKVRYLIDRYKVRSEEILLISFTKKSADTLAVRTGIGGFEAKTFHKFGLDIIVSCEGAQPSLFDARQFKPLLKRYFNELLQDAYYLHLVTDYFVDYLKLVKPQTEFETHGDYIQYIKDQNFSTYKLVEVTTKTRTTYKMEVVKSIEECRIGNFLLFNGIDYSYESPYEISTATETHRQYKPDFTITQNGKKVYLEHFGVSRDGSVPGFFAKEGETMEHARARYTESILWKRNLHKSNSTTLVESYSYEMYEGTLFGNLRTKLEAVGVELRPKSSQEIWQIIANAAREEVDEFVELFATFITLMKSNNFSIQDVRSTNEGSKEEFFRKRNNLFLELIEPLYQRYEARLQEQKEIDFSDMINRSTAYVRQGKVDVKYQYVIIDEFQDISIGRYQLVKAVLDRNPGCRLFCVGDDWQSIYRFSGSDMALFKDFEKYFGVTARSKIETTYRFHNPLIKLSSDFIQRSRNQTPKQLRGASTVKTTTYKIHYSGSDNQDDTHTVRSIFNQLLVTDPDIAKKEIFILGRYSFDIKRLKNEGGVFSMDPSKEWISYSARGKSGAVKSLKAQYMTVHKSKGLEADVVIVLNCNSGRLGFPSEIADDPVLNLLLSSADQYPHGEERRLFYVAMTRARESVHFVAERNFKSVFIDELETKTSQPASRKCPDCKRGDIIVKKTGTAKNGRKYSFYGCTNYEYGCEYSKMVWEKT